ncbi:MAG: hypothetical protein HYU66_00610, partial [Armatimonadetes bacterium]|nr:hypothetical protein [Armatimonadota bacterium]
MAVSAEERERRRSEHAAQAARDYPELEELIARAHMLGAKSVDILTGGWEETPLGQTYVAVCHLVTEAGFSTTRRGRARPGDSQAEDARPADQDIFVESRAEARSLRAALRTAFPAAD